MPLCHTAPHSALHMHQTLREIMFQEKYLAVQKLFQYVSSRSKSFFLQKQGTGGYNHVTIRGQGRRVGTEGPCTSDNRQTCLACLRRANCLSQSWANITSCLANKLFFGSSTMNQPIRPNLDRCYLFGLVPLTGKYTGWRLMCVNQI